jgi:hypothetical protein
VHATKPCLLGALNGISLPPSVLCLFLPCSLDYMLVPPPLACSRCSEDWCFNPSCPLYLGLAHPSLVSLWMTAPWPEDPSWWWCQEVEGHVGLGAPVTHLECSYGKYSWVFEDMQYLTHVKLLGAFNRLAIHLACLFLATGFPQAQTILSNCTHLLCLLLAFHRYWSNKPAQRTFGEQGECESLVCCSML